LRKIFTTVITMVLIGFTFCTNTQAESLTEIPEDIREICEEAGEEFNICPTMLMSLIYTESRGIVTENLTQITNKNWFKEGMEACKVDEVKTPENNIRVCAYYIAKWGRENDDIYLAIDSWRYGPENAQAKYNPDKPSRYAKEIVKRSAEWEQEWYKSKTED